MSILPPHPGTFWQECSDVTTGYPYYWNTITNQVRQQTRNKHIGGIIELKQFENVSNTRNNILYCLLFTAEFYACMKKLNTICDFDQDKQGYKEGFAGSHGHTCNVIPWRLHTTQSWYSTGRVSFPAPAHIPSLLYVEEVLTYFIQLLKI